MGAYQTKQQVHRDDGTSFFTQILVQWLVRPTKEMSLTLQKEKGWTEDVREKQAVVLDGRLRALGDKLERVNQRRLPDAMHSSSSLLKLPDCE